MEKSPRKKIAIVGAGIMGASLAHHLAEYGQPATLYDAVGVAAAASGKAAGFLASNWCNPPVHELARESFNLHEKHALEFGEIGYRRLEAYSISLTPNNSENGVNEMIMNKTKSSPVAWIDGNVRPTGRVGCIGTTDTCAQVTPRALTEALVQSAHTRVGTEVVQARVTDVQSEGHRWKLRLERGANLVGENVNTTNEEEWIVVDMVALCMGPWSTMAQSWFPSLPPIVALKAASLVCSVELPATVLFTQYENERGEVREPEVYPRAEELYVCQTAVPDDLPRLASEVQVHERDERDLKQFAGALSDKVKRVVMNEEYVTQACHLPVSPDGVPVIGAVPGCEGVFIATGHSCWGILNGPATGRALAQVMITGKSSIDLRAFDAGRFTRR